MNVPVEIIIWLAGGNLAFISLCAHMLVRLSDRFSKFERRQAVIEFQLGIRPATQDN